MNEHYDVIIVGTGAGGGSLLHRLAGSGKRILVLERGPFLSREKDNWSYHGSFKYYSSETMYTCDGYPCMVQTKSEADVLAVRPALREPNITLLTETKVDQSMIIDYTENNSEPFDRLVERWKCILKEIGCGCRIVSQANHFAPKSGYFTTKMQMHSLGHQVGTCKFGEDPKTSVLDLNCRVHGLDNLYVLDGSFFVSSGAVNPRLTIIAKALRVGDHLLERLKSPGRTHNFSAASPAPSKAPEPEPLLAK